MTYATINDVCKHSHHPSITMYWFFITCYSSISCLMFLRANVDYLWYLVNILSKSRDYTLNDLYLRLQIWPAYDYVSMWIADVDCWRNQHSHWTEWGVNHFALGSNLDLCHSSYFKTLHQTAFYLTSEPKLHKTQIVHTKLSKSIVSQKVTAKFEEQSKLKWTTNKNGQSNPH